MFGLRQTYRAFSALVFIGATPGPGQAVQQQVFINQVMELHFVEQSLIDYHTTHEQIIHPSKAGTYDIPPFFQVRCA